MRQSRVVQGSALGIGAALLIASLAGAGLRSTAVPVSGKAELKYAARDTSPTAAGQVVQMGRTEGVNENTGSGDYFAGAKVVNMETAELVRGNGTHQGYYTAMKGGDATTAKWEGTVTTVMDAKGNPNTSFKGTWTYVRGAGRYKNIKGKGTYEGKFLAPDRYEVHWKGVRE